MTDYNLFRALEICMNKARKQAISEGVETGIMVASTMNIPQEGSTDEMTDEISIERMMTWGKPSESKCDFVRKYVRNHRKELAQHGISDHGMGRRNRVGHDRIPA